MADRGHAVALRRPLALEKIRRDARNHEYKPLQTVQQRRNHREAQMRGFALGVMVAAKDDASEPQETRSDKDRKITSGREMSVAVSLALLPPVSCPSLNPTILRVCGRYEGYTRLGSSDLENKGVIEDLLSEGVLDHRKQGVGVHQ
eukprot:756749-Hanusia_phi.AAC.15